MSVVSVKPRRRLFILSLSLAAPAENAVVSYWKGLWACGQFSSYLLLSGGCDREEIVIPKEHGTFTCFTSSFGSSVIWQILGNNSMLLQIYRMIKKNNKTKTLLHTILSMFMSARNRCLEGHVSSFYWLLCLNLKIGSLKRELTPVQLTLLTLSQSWAGKSLVLLSVPLRTHSCSKIGVKGVRKITRSWGYGKNLSIYFTLVTSGFSRQHCSLFKARVSPNLETVTDRRLKWSQEND